MKDLRSLHPSSELLERFAMDQLPNCQTAYVEEHMLLCPSCCDDLTAVEADIKMMRVVLGGLESTTPVWVQL
jgi:hypothetical protein